MVWYVVSKDKKVVARCDYEPDTKDIKSRGEIKVESKEFLPLEKAVYKNKKIVSK